MKAIVPSHTTAVYGRNAVTDGVMAGDLVLVRHHGIAASSIRFAERLRRPRGISRADWHSYCRVNHACIALTGSPRVLVAQATAAGIVVTPMHEMDAYALGIVHVQAVQAQREAVLAFARDSIGTGYGYAQVVADLLNAATGLELSLGWGSRMVCSTAATRALERTGFVPNRSPDCTTPAHLAAFFDVKVPAD